MRIPGHREQTIVALDLAFALLLDLKNADDPAGQDDARKCRCVMHDHNNYRIAVVGFGGRHEPPIVRISEPGKKRLR